MKKQGCYCLDATKGKGLVKEKKRDDYPIFLFEKVYFN